VSFGWKTSDLWPEVAVRIDDQIGRTRWPVYRAIGPLRHHVTLNEYAAALDDAPRGLDGTGKDRLEPPAMVAKGAGRIPGVQNTAGRQRVELECIPRTAREVAAESG